MGGALLGRGLTAVAYCCAERGVDLRSGVAAVPVPRGHPH
jgi:hypothetical protein